MSIPLLLLSTILSVTDQIGGQTAYRGKRPPPGPFLVDGNEHGAPEFSLLSAPKQGTCESFFDFTHLHVECNLDNKFTIAVSMTPHDMTITFTQGSSMACEELQKAEHDINEYMFPVEGSKRMEILNIKNVTLTSVSLFCPLGMIHAVGCDTLILDRPRGELLPVHVEGFEGLKILRLLHVERNVTSVPYNVLAHLPSAHSFTLTGAALELKSEHQVLPQLITLELSSGLLKSLPKGAFKHMPNLKNLNLFSNIIDFIDVDAFEGLLNLENIILHNNLISVLPEGVFRFSPNLFRIDLYENPLTDLTENVFTGLRNLTQIYLFSNIGDLKIHELAFANLPSLTQLPLDDNSILSLPADVFANSTNLETIVLRSNKLTNLPENIFFGLKLKELSLENNSLVSLFKNQFFNQTKLQRLDLQLNSLTEVPVGLFKDLNNLEILNLESNLIEKLDDYIFKGLTKLKKLYLAKNKIKIITEILFEPIQKLEVLSLAHNGLTISQSENTKIFSEITILNNSNFKFFSALKNCKTLTELDLSHNNISVICLDWRFLYNLKLLDLSNNQITELTAQDTNFPVNAKIDLSNNNIQYIDFYEVESGNDEFLIKIPTFIINNNPFACDCELFPFVYSYTHRNKYFPIIQMDGAECFQPSHLSNTKLTDLRPDTLTCDTTCPTGCSTCQLRPDARQVELTCTKTPEIWPNVTNDYNAISIKLQKLDNRHLNLPPTVHYLDVSNLMLTEPPILLSDTPLVVNLTRNLLKIPPIDLLQKNCSTYVQYNPIECECSHEIDIQRMFVYNASIKDFNIARCSDKRLISTIDPDSLCHTRNAIVAVSAVLLSIILLMVILLIIVYRNNTLVRILVTKFCCVPERAYLSNCKYDAFVSFVEDDERFIYQKVIPNLEKSRNPLKLCIHTRDWVIGEVIPSQIETSVEQSRKTIIVLSRSYMESKWCEMEFRVAHGKDRVIILMLEDFSKDASLTPELKAYISLKTYVKASDPFVWDRLKYAVLRNNKKRQKVHKSKRDVQVIENGVADTQL